MCVWVAFCCLQRWRRFSGKKKNLTLEALFLRFYKCDALTLTFSPFLPSFLYAGSSYSCNGAAKPAMPQLVDVAPMAQQRCVGLRHEAVQGWTESRLIVFGLLLIFLVKVELFASNRLFFSDSKKFVFQSSKTNSTGASWCRLSNQKRTLKIGRVFFFFSPALSAPGFRLFFLTKSGRLKF